MDSWEIWMKFEISNFKLLLMIVGWDIFCKIALKWMPLDLIDDKSTLVQVMAWCRRAPSHYLSQCWPRSMSPYGISRLQWVRLQRIFSEFTWLSYHHCGPNDIIQNGQWDQAKSVALMGVNYLSPGILTAIFNSLAPVRFLFNFR